MTDPAKFIVGTSGYSFGDWVGPFYPPGTQKREMLDLYSQQFATSELNFTYYRMPTAKTLAAMARKTPPGFDFWVKANQQLTHEADRSVAPAFLDALGPLTEADKLAGVLIQLPQRFHRTVANRKYLAQMTADLAAVPLAVEFRHRSWQVPATAEGLAKREITLVVPDVPEIGNLYQVQPTLTSRTGYLRLHSRNADLWYAGAVQRYDYDYSRQEMTDLLDDWANLSDQADRVYVFFNNCHRGQAARNAEDFRRILGQIP